MAVEISPNQFNNGFSIHRIRNHTQTNTRSHMRNVLLIWLDPEMHWHGRASGMPVRSPTFSDNVVQFCLAMKGLLDMPLGPATDVTKQLLRATGLNNGFTGDNFDLNRLTFAGLRSAYVHYRFCNFLPG